MLLKKPRVDMSQVRGVSVQTVVEHTFTTKGNRARSLAARTQNEAELFLSTSQSLCVSNGLVRVRS